MSEEEIIKDLDNVFYNLEDMMSGSSAEDERAKWQQLKDLYQKEKEKNKWRPISEYDRKKYDWVLVKYFDGDYECVPEVAEKRANGKWYTSDREIPLEVKYFVDIQELLE